MVTWQWYKAPEADVVVHLLVEATADVVGRCGATEKRQTPLQATFTTFDSRVRCTDCRKR